MNENNPYSAQCPPDVAAHAATILVTVDSRQAKLIDNPDLFLTRSARDGWVLWRETPDGKCSKVAGECMEPGLQISIDGRRVL